MNGGELFTHLVQRVHFKEQEVTLYSGEIVLALEHLHKVKLHAHLHSYLLISFAVQQLIQENSQSSFFLISLLFTPAYSNQFLSASQSWPSMTAVLEHFSKALFTEKGREGFLMHGCSVHSRVKRVARGPAHACKKRTLTVRLTMFWFRLHFLS